MLFSASCTMFLSCCILSKMTKYSKLKHVIHTLWDVAAHHGHVALVYQVPYGHVPPSSATYPGVAAILSCQVVDIDARVFFLHYSNCMVGGDS